MKLSTGDIICHNTAKTYYLAVEYLGDDRFGGNTWRMYNFIDKSFVRMRFMDEHAPYWTILT